MILVHNKYENMDNKFWQVLDFTTKLPKDKEASELTATKNSYYLLVSRSFSHYKRKQSSERVGMESWDESYSKKRPPFEITTEITEINQT